MPTSHILLVEDEPAVALVLHEVLVDQGYTVTVAQDGKVAIELLQRAPLPDMVITDLHLPYLNGYEIVKYIRHTPALKRIPIVIVTASLIQELLLKDQVQAIFYKPFSLNEIIDAVATLLCLTVHTPTLQ